MTDAIDLELITVERLPEIPKGALTELEQDELAPLQGKVYIFRAPTPIGGREYVKRFVERIQE